MPRYDRHAGPSAEQNALHTPSAGGVDEGAVEDAAAALREAEVEAAQPEPEAFDLSTLDAAKLESMNIDELRVVAKELEIPDRATITDSDELIAAIRARIDVR